MRPHIASRIKTLSCPVTWGNQGLTFGILRGFYYPKKVEGYLLYY